MGEGGQAIAEFGLVLPMLALLTFGTIEVAIYLQQQAALNGVAFVAARAASVTGGEGRYGKDAANEVAKAAGMPWLERAAASTRMEAGAGATRAQLKAKVDRFSGIISALSGGKAKGFDELGAMSTLPLEWEAKRHRQTNATGKPRTMYRVNYAGKLPMPDPLAKAKALVQKVRDAAAKIPLEIVVPAPTPKPTPKPTPRPTPKPGASTEPGGPSIITPGKPTPAPKPTAPPQPRRFVVPGARELRAFPFGNGAEPFSDRYAVVANPRARNDAGDGGQGTSSQYLSSRYEDGPPVSGEFPWKLSTLMEGLTSYGE